MKKPHSQGFSLIEVLVALLITAIGLLGLASLQMKSLRAESNSLSRSQAIFIADDTANRIYANEAYASAYLTSADGINCDTLTAPAKICADQRISESSVVAAQTCLNNTEIATFDLWDALCRNNVADGIQNHGNNYMAAVQMKISCDGFFAPATCGPAPNIAIEVSWLNRNINSEIDASNSLNNDRLSYTLRIVP